MKVTENENQVDKYGRLDDLVDEVMTYSDYVKTDNGYKKR